VKINLLQEKLNIISELFSQNQSNICCENNKFFATGDCFCIEKVCTEKDIHTDNKECKLLIKVKSFLEIQNLVTFLEINRYFESKFLETDFVILNSDGDFCYKESNNSPIIWKENINSGFKQHCVNLFSYYELYNFFKSKSFSDHHNDANAEIVIYSSVKGIFRISYLHTPNIPGDIDISDRVYEIIETAKPIQIRSFFKNALFTFSDGKGIISIEDIISKSPEIIESAKRDFELASKQFDFEKFKDSLYKEKEKYFNSIREILNKIFTQAIGIPISITATVFATYKVSDDIVLMLIILISFAIYVCFYIKIQLIFKCDISEIKMDFQRDFDIIKSKSGIPENSIDNEKIKIERKIEDTLILIKWLIIIIIAFGLIVGIYVFYEIGSSQIIKAIKYLYKSIEHTITL